jgi:catechol 2,3-dioxygenase-like lactoylglutathione lyase family enzyme
MDWTLEVVVLPVSDIDRAIAFYRDQVGFALDHDTHNEHMHVAQLTPRGSGCSIVVGDLPAQRAMTPTRRQPGRSCSSAVSRRARSRSSTSATGARSSASATLTGTRGPCSS